MAVGQEFTTISFDGDERSLAATDQPLLTGATLAVAARPEYPAVEGEGLELGSSDGSSCEACRSRRSRHRPRSRSGRLFAALSDALCVCDECYTPEWHLLESASFWVDSARPQNRTRIRWDYGRDMMLADRAEYFWARTGGLGPDPPAGSQSLRSLDYHELSHYSEISHEKFSAFVITPYRSLYMNELGHSAGFADIQLGTKSLLYDTPLMQIALQTTTSIPSANSKRGLGVGHVSLEPALLFGLSLTERSYMQAQVAEWIPLGGDPQYAGALLRWGVSLNRIAWQHDADNMMSVNLDLFGWSFQDGAYTDPVLGTRSANNETYFYIGPGMRLLLCGKFELGVGTASAVTDRHFAEQVIRTEMTIRY